MTRSPTSRLKLIKESDDELIDQYEYNWPILDGLAGVKVVANGVTPPDSDLYNGCIVSEQTSGKVWMAYKNPSTGFYEKKWLFFPWQIEATRTVGGMGNAPGAATKYDFSGIGQASRCFNSSAADIVGGKIVTPVDALYSIDWTVYFSTPNAAGNNPFSVYAEVNGDGAYLTNETMERVNDAIYTSYTGTRLQRMVQGTQVSMVAWNGSGVTQATTIFNCTVSVVTCC